MSFGALPRFVLYSLYVQYCTACSSCLKVGLVLEMYWSLQWAYLIHQSNSWIKHFSPNLKAFTWNIEIKTLFVETDEEKKLKRTKKNVLKVKFFPFLILFSVNVKAPTALELFGNFKTEDFNPLENSAGVFNIPSSISKFFSDSSKQEDTTATPVRQDDYTVFKYLVIIILDRKLKKSLTT